MVAISAIGVHRLSCTQLCSMANELGVGVCIDHQGRVNGSCGSGMRFDIRTMTGQDDVLGMVVSWPLMAVLALPFAVLRSVHTRRNPIRLRAA